MDGEGNPRTPRQEKAPGDSKHRALRIQYSIDPSQDRWRVVDQPAFLIWSKVFVAAVLEALERLLRNLGRQLEQLLRLSAGGRELLLHEARLKTDQLRKRLGAGECLCSLEGGLRVALGILQNLVADRLGAGERGNGDFLEDLGAILGGRRNLS